MATTVRQTYDRRQYDRQRGTSEVNEAFILLKLGRPQQGKGERLGGRQERRKGQLELLMGSRVYFPP
jgi:hypothetical protein